MHCFVWILPEFQDSLPCFWPFLISTPTTKQIGVVDLRNGWSLSSVAAVLSRFQHVNSSAFKLSKTYGRVTVRM